MSDTAMNSGGPLVDSTGNNKRKRESIDAGDAQHLARSPPNPAGNGGMHNSVNNNLHGYDTHGLGNPPELSHIDQQLLQHVGGQNGVSDENAMTAKAALAAHQQPQSKYPPPETAFDNGSLGHNLTFGEEVSQVSMSGVHGHNSTAAAVYAAREAQSIKPAVGSPEWHTIRKNNHKEVERRRRETINEGINEIAKMVPGCEKAKGSILQRAIQYIAKLQEEVKDMAARWDTTNMTTNQAIAEISAQNAKLKGEVNRRGIIAAKWMQRCRDNGLDFDDYEDEKELGQIEVDDVQV